MGEIFRHVEAAAIVPGVITESVREELSKILNTGADPCERDGAKIVKRKS